MQTLSLWIWKLHRGGKSSFQKRQRRTLRDFYICKIESFQIPILNYWRQNLWNDSGSNTFGFYFNLWYSQYKQFLLPPVYLFGNRFLREYLIEDVILPNFWRRQDSLFRENWIGYGKNEIIIDIRAILV